MARILINELASVLNERKKLNKKDATNFVNELFNLIQEGLDEDRLVKVKGLGTFKIIEVDDRESVNVNTGERVLIEGHGKISFTPDSLMKELVNKPFSQFETVVLNEGVDFSDMHEEVEVTEEQVKAEEPVVEEKPVTIENEEPSMAPLVDFVSEPEPVVESKPEPEVVLEPESEPVIEESAELEATEEEAPEEGEVEVEESGFNWKKWLIPAVFCIIVFAGGYLFGLFVKGQKEVVPEKVEKKTVADVNKSAADMKKSETDMKKPVAEEPGVLQKEDVAVETEQKTEAVLDKYEEMDIRVRTGAYRILGLDHMEKIKAGDNLTRICKRTIGVGMECYLEVFNGIKPDTELKVGDEIKIPKLELKKKKSQKPL